MTPAASTSTPGLGFTLAGAFHGSTLLSFLLNNHSAVSALGDTNPTREFDQPCSCGERVSTCKFWQTLVERTDANRFSKLEVLLPSLPSSRLRRRIAFEHFGDPAKPRAPAAASWVSSHLGRRLDEIARLQWTFGRDPGGWLDAWRRFYAAVADLQGTSWVIDGEKNVEKAGFLTHALGAERSVALIHLVRDPRGFANSWKRYFGAPDLAEVVEAWATHHQNAERLSSDPRYVRVRYEDLATCPQDVMSLLFRALGVDCEEVVGPPRRPEKHHLIGNKMVSSFDGHVELDDRWRRDLSSAEQGGVLRAAGDLAERYGYF